MGNVLSQAEGGRYLPGLISKKAQEVMKSTLRTTQACILDLVRLTWNSQPAGLDFQRGLYKGEILDCAQKSTVQTN